MVEKITIRELRARHKMSQEEAAKKIGVSTQTYNSWENDFGKVKIRFASKVAELYKVKLDDIFFED